jgi:drug/metabolite transporter (DMT)-like permease
VWTVALGWWLLRERLNARRAWGLLLGMAGMFILVSSEVSDLRAAPVGAILILAAAVSWALGTVLFKKFPVALSTSAATGWMMVLGGLPIWILTPILERGEIRMPSLAPLLALLYNMFIAFNLCYWAWQRIVSIAPANVSALSTLMTPVVGVLSGMWLLGEKPHWQEFSALALVIAALAVVLLPVGFLHSWRPRSK